MLFSLLRNGSLSVAEKLLYILVIAFCVLLSLSVHELCHGLAAYLMGDKTAKNSGRLSLNPMHHLDPIGAVCLFLFGFGWARPVPVNPWNFKHKKGGMALTALGGPIANFGAAWRHAFCLGEYGISGGIGGLYDLLLPGAGESGTRTV